MNIKVNSMIQKLLLSFLTLSLFSCTSYANVCKKCNDTIDHVKKGHWYTSEDCSYAPSGSICTLKHKGKFRGKTLGDKEGIVTFLSGHPWCCEKRH